MKKIIKLFLLAVLCAFFGLSSHGTAHAQDGPFTCSPDFYQVISGQLNVLNPTNGTYEAIGSVAPFNYNAMGYNVQDNYLYAIGYSGSYVGELIKIGSDGTATVIGFPTGLPVVQYTSGDFDQSGNLWVHSGGNTLYEINVATNTATPVSISGSSIVNGFDMVFINNSFYTIVGQTMSIINLSSDTDTNVTIPTLPSTGSYGAAWTDANGDLYFSNNNTGSIYQITGYTSGSPTATFIINGATTSNNDGASCSLATESTFSSPLMTNASYTTPYATPLDESTSVLSGDSGSGLTITGNTSPAHGSVTFNSDGSFVYTPAKGFIGLDSFEYTVVDSFGRSATATVSINVSAPATANAPPDTGFGQPQAKSGTMWLKATLGITAIVLLWSIVYRYRYHSQRKK